MEARALRDEDDDLIEIDAILRDEIVNGRDQLLLHMRLVARVVIEVAAIDVVVADQRHNESAALVLVLEKAVLHVLRHMELRRPVRAVAGALAAGRTELVDAPTRALLRKSDNVQKFMELVINYRLRIEYANLHFNP